MKLLVLSVLMLVQSAGQPGSLVDRWSVTDVTRRPVVELVARDNPLPLYWAGSPEVFPVPEGVPIVGVIPTMAEHIFGFWPRIEKDGTPVYGGTPIGHNLNLHLAKLREQLTRRDAKPTFIGDRVRAAGVLCFDFEAWPIAWERVDAKYRALAIEQIRERNPDAVRHMTDEQVEALTAREWERRANEIFVRSAEVVRETIPGTRVGYYGLTVQRRTWPDAWEKTDARADEWRERNEASMPTVRASDILFPTIYNFYHNGGNDGRGYVELNVGEARRLADLANAEDGGDRQVIPYVWGLYHPSNAAKAFTPIDAEDAVAHIHGSVAAGADGLALWDSVRLWDRHRRIDRAAFRSGIWQLYTDLYAEPYAEMVKREVQGD
ncbi:MAG: hypothetical protein AAGD32_09160 [Planctomycetota bacterium]